MASLKSLVISGGRVKQIPDADTLLTGVGLDRATAGVLVVGGSTATEVELGAGGIPTEVLGNLTVQGTETVVGTTTFQGDTNIGDDAADTLTLVAEIDSDMTFEEASGRSITMGTPADEVAQSSLSLTGGVGGASANSAAGGVGSPVAVSGGTGGAGAAAQLGGAGGSLTLNAGAGGATGGGGAGADGNLVLGAANTAALQFGNATDDPNFQFLGAGELQFSGTGGSAAQILTSNGAGAAPTWQAAATATTTLQQAYSNDVDGSDVTITSDATDGKVIYAGDQDWQFTTSGTLDVNSAADFSGGLTNSAGELLVSGGNMQLNDSINLTLGTGDDLTLVHSGTGSSMTNSLGDLTIENTDVDDDIVLKLGTATSATALKVQDSAAEIQFSVAMDGQADFIGNVDATGGLDVDADSVALTVGAGADLSIVHNGTDTIATSATGDFVLDNTLATGSTIMRLGTDTTATSFEVQNNSASALFAMLGAGDFQVAGDSGTVGQLLISGGAGAAPSWGSASISGTSAENFHINDDAAATDTDDASLRLCAGRGAGGSTVQEFRFSMDHDATGGAGSFEGDLLLQYAPNNGGAFTTLMTVDGADDHVTFSGNVDAANGLDVTTAALTAAAALTVSGGALTMSGSNIDLDPTGTFDLAMDSAQTVTISLADALADAMLIQQGSDAYLDITTSNGTEKMEFGNGTTNPGYEFLGTGLVDIANGSADIPSGTSMAIGGSSLSANFTQANIDEATLFFANTDITGAEAETLTDGSNADALHVHAAAPATQLEVASQTTTGLADGDFGYVTAADTWTKTDADVEASSIVTGVNEGTVSTMTLPGAVIEAAKFTTVGGSPAHGAEVYLAPGTEEASAAGKLTATAPSAAGDTVAVAGICLNDANYAASKTAKIIFLPKTPVLL